MIKEVRQNQHEIIKNRYGIQDNEKAINENKEAIKDLKNKYVSHAIFESTVEKYDKIIHRLIIIIAGIIAMLVISNALWINAWRQIDFKDQTTVIKQDGSTNTVEAKEEP